MGRLQTRKGSGTGTGLDSGTPFRETEQPRSHTKQKRERRKDAALPAFLVVRYIILFFFFPPMPAHRGPADISTQPGNTHTHKSIITTLQYIHICYTVFYSSSTTASCQQRPVVIYHRKTCDTFYPFITTIKKKVFNEMVLAISNVIRISVNHFNQHRL